MYDLIKDYVADALKLGGFRVKRDFRCPLGWIDVVGFKRGISVGIEIANDPQKVRSKLMSHPFTFRFVVTEEDAYEESDGIVVVGYKKFREVLSDIFEFNAPAFEDWLKSVQRGDEEFYNRVFEALKRKLSDEILAKKVVDAMIYIYMAGEIVEDYSGKVTERIPYSRLFPILVECGFASRETKEIVNPKTFMVSLTHDGVRIAKFALRKNIENRRDEIDRIIFDVGEEVVYILSVGLAERKGLSLKEMDFEFSEVSLSGSVDEIYYSILPTLANIDLDEVIKMLYGMQFTPLSAFCRVLSYTVLYHKAKEFFEELFKAGLSARVPVYDYYGRFYGYEYRTSKEVAECISKRVYADIDGSIISKFQNILDLAFLKLRDTKDLEIAVERGIIRVKKGGLEVVDRNRFNEFIKARMARITAEALANILP
jgi:hypothetical protein